MKLRGAFTLLLLATVAFAGCYTQVGYYASSDFDRKYHRILEKEKTEDHSEAELEKSESEHADTEKAESEGYYGRRKYTRRTVYAYPSSYGNYWMPYMPYPYGYYLPVVRYYPHPWFYGYRYYGYAPYYRGYYPYTNVYRRYYRGSRYMPLSGRTYNKRGLRLENKRSRSARSVTSPKSRSERPQRRTRNRNEN